LLLLTQQCWLDDDDDGHIGVTHGLITVFDFLCIGSDFSLLVSVSFLCVVETKLAACQFWTHVSYFNIVSRNLFIYLYSTEGSRSF